MDKLLENIFPNSCDNSSCYNETELEEASASTIIYNQIEFPTDRKTRLINLGLELSTKTLRIATLQNAPLSFTVEENGTLVGKGVAFDFIRYLKQKYKFQYTVVLPKDDILGDNDTGIVGMLNHDEADIAAAFLPVIPKFWQSIQYSSNLDTGEWVVLMKRPAESATGSGLLAPFTLDVWVIILASLICVGPIIYFLIYIHKKLCKDSENTSANLSACVWFVYGALLKQGSTIMPITDSSRLLFATWWIFITILTAFYTANLTAFLTLSKFTLPVNKPEEIGEKHYTWVTKTGNAVQHAVNNEKEALNKYFKGSHDIYVSDSNEQILEMYVNQKNYLYIGEKPIVEHMMFNDYLNKTREGVAEEHRCTFIITTWPVLSRGRAFAYTKNFIYKELIDDTLGHLVESGIVKFKMRDNLPDAKICPLDLGSKERQLRNTDLLLTYYIVAGGFAISGVVFLIEILVKFVRKMKMTKNGSSTHSSEFPPPPPPYHSLFGAPFSLENRKKQNINGRDYWVVKSKRGEHSFVPTRTPSALLFQYTH